MDIYVPIFSMFLHQINIYGSVNKHIWYEEPCKNMVRGTVYVTNEPIIIDIGFKLVQSVNKHIWMSTRNHVKTWYEEQYM